jgi:putative FmdB family regulatory protein
LPLYEYKCEGCGETFEVIQKFSDEPLTVHEKCGGHVHKLMSAPAFQFKGTGWYVTDYAKGNVSGPPKPESGKGEAGKGESSKNDTGKGDSGKGDSGKNDSGKSESGKSDSSSKSTETATKTESKPAPSSSSKND